MMNDGNNTVNEGATLKINWRLVVKDPRRRCVASACELVPVGLKGLHGLVGEPLCA